MPIPDMENRSSPVIWTPLQSTSYFDTTVVFKMYDAVLLHVVIWHTVTVGNLMEEDDLDLRTISYFHDFDRNIK